MTNEKFFLGYPYNFKDICYIYPPKINEIITNDKFFQSINIFTQSQEDIEDEYNKNGMDLDGILTPFEMLLNLAFNSEESKKLIEMGFQLLTHEEVTFFYELKKIGFGAPDELAKLKKIEYIRFLTEDIYFDFQNTVRGALGIKAVEPYNPNEDPRVRRIKAKGRYREKVKAKSGKGLSLKDTLSSICCMGIGINPLNIGELSYVAVQDLLKRYQIKEKFDIDLHSIWAGADQKKHKITPEHWIKNLDE